jgi:O-antigen/teichoic acid export membrane protein
MSQVFFQQLTLRKNNREKTLPLLKNMIKKLFIIALPIALVIFFSSPYIFPIIFGKNWSVSGDIAQYLAFIFLITFIVSPLSVAFTVSMELRKVAIWQYLYLISSTIFFFLFYIYKVEFEKFLFYFVIHEYILYLIYLFMIIKTTQKMDIINLKGKN